MSNPMMKQPPRPRQPDCMACRLTGGGVFLGLGGYAIYEARRQGTFDKVRPKGSSVIGGRIQAVVGVVLISLGIGRLVLPQPRPFEKPT